MVKVRIKDLRENPEYIETLAGWHHKQWGYLYPAKTLEKRLELMQKYLEDGAIPSTYIAVDGYSVVGSAAIVESDMDIRPELTPWLASVYVDPDVRGSGVGSLLVLRVLDHARVNGVRKMYLYTPDKESLYRRLGWKTIEKVEYLGQDVTVMEIVL